MSIIVSQHTRNILARSISQVSTHQDAIAAAMSQTLDSDLNYSRIQLGRSPYLLEVSLITSHSIIAFKLAAPKRSL